MKLDGRPPAESPPRPPGSSAGDIIVKIGAREIHQHRRLRMACFGELQPGVAVPVVVEREGRRSS